MHILWIILCVLTYITCGSFIDDICRSTAEKNEKKYDVPAWFVMMLWPIPVVMAAVEMIGGKNK